MFNARFWPITARPTKPISEVAVGVAVGARASDVATILDIEGANGCWKDGRKIGRKVGRKVCCVRECVLGEREGRSGRGLMKADLETGFMV